MSTNVNRVVGGLSYFNVDFFQFFQGCVRLIIYVSDQTTRSEKKGIVGAIQ